MKSRVWTKPYENRRSFIGGSDARIIMGDYEAALIRLWHEKRGEAEPEDLSGNLIVQFGLVTEALNRLGTSATPGKRSHASSIGSGIRCSGGWGRPLTASSPARSGIRSQIHAALVVLGRNGGREAYGAAPA